MRKWESETVYTASPHNLPSRSVSLPSPAVTILFHPLAQTIPLNSLHLSHSHSVFSSLNAKSPLWPTSPQDDIIHHSAAFLRKKKKKGIFSFKILHCASIRNLQLRAMLFYFNDIQRAVIVLTIVCWQSWSDTLKQAWHVRSWIINLLESRT